MPLLHLQREKQTYGYFSPERFVNSQGTRTDEIAMNPAYFAVCPPEEIMQTLCHEMCHLWQHHFGKPGRRGYHNKEWADFMEAIGHCCKVSDEAAFCLIQRPYISKTLLTRRISPRG
ncbi:SprT-like domain-containing protein, partial [Escherichia coli]